MPPTKVSPEGKGSPKPKKEAAEGGHHANKWEKVKHSTLNQLEAKPVAPGEKTIVHQRSLGSLKRGGSVPKLMVVLDVYSKHVQKITKKKANKQMTKSVRFKNVEQAKVRLEAGSDDPIS